MVGKIIKENGMMIVLSPYGNYIINNDEPLYDSVTDKLKHNIPVWVEFDINHDKVQIETLYDYTFGTHLEGISTATARYEKNRYPISGFQPGYHMDICSTCENDYVGDKKSTQCEICAINEVINYVEITDEESLKDKLDGLIEYYSKMLKITRDINYRGVVDVELKKVREEINIIKNKLK